MGEKTRKISPDKKFSAEINGALLNVISCTNDGERYSIALNKYDLRKPDIFRWSANSKAIGMFIVKGVPFDAGGYTSAKTNYWLGIWYPFSNKFYTVHFPNHFNLEINYEPIDSIEVLAEERLIICSIKGKEFKRVQMPSEQTLSNWEKENQGLENKKNEPIRTDKREWTWNHSADGYEGVNLYGGEVLWFSHSNNPHSGGGANGQSFADFLKQGPACFTPPEFAGELFETVRYLVSEKEKQNSN